MKIEKKGKKVGKKFPGTLILFEGPEGAGKTTLIKSLVFDLKNAGITREIVTTKEPGCNTPLGTEGSKKLQNGVINMTPGEILDLFIEIRADHFKKIIIPALRWGHLILCDRSSYSTVAYQHFGYGLDSTRILTLDARARQNVGFDRVILLDIDPRIGLTRKNPETRFELLGLDFHDRVRNGYLELAAEDPDRKWLVVDASLSREVVRDLVFREIIRIADSRGMRKNSRKREEGAK